MRSISLFPFGLFILGILSTWAQEEQEHEKGGACPKVLPGECAEKIRSECVNDFWRCPDIMKCCPTICGKKCMDPVQIKKPVWNKYGKCKPPARQCSMAYPPNRCKSDGDCVRNLKCCKGSCGKVCKPPV